MNTNEIKKLYTALRGKGYSTYDLGDENAFETKMSNKSNRKELYDWVSSRGDFRMGDYEKYEERLTSPMQPEGTTTGPIRGISMAPVDQIEQTESVVQPQQEEDEYQPLSFGQKMLLKGMSRSAKNLGVRNNPAQAVIDADKEMRELEENRQQFMDETQLQEVRQANRQQVRDLQADIQSKLQQTQPQDFIWGGVDQTPQMMVRATRMDMDPNTAKHRTLIAANSALDNAQKIINEADRHGADGTYGSWLETSFAGNAARGLGDKLFDVSTWDMGLTDMKDATILKEALDSYDAGRPLTEEQQALLDAKAVELATQAYFGSYLGRGYKAGQVTAEAIPFMIEMAINPASAMGKSAGNMMARYALKRFGKGAATKALSRGARVAGDIAGASTMAATTGIGRVASDATERMAGQVQFATDEDNRSVFAGHTEGEDPATAVAKAFGATTIENYSEMFGNYFSPILGGAGKMFRKGADKIGAGKVVKMLDDVAASDLARIVSDFEKNAQWSGTISEYAEEVAGGIMNAIFVGDQTLDTAEGTGVFNLDQNIDTFLGVALLGGAMSTVKTVGYPIEKYQANKRVSKADKAGLSAFHNAEAWNAVKEKISVDDIEQRTEALTDIMLDNNMSEEQKVSAFKYVEALQNRDGVRMGVMKHNQDPTVPREQVEVEQSYDNGYTLETSQELNDAKVQLDAQAENLRRTWGSDADQDIDEILGEDPYALIRKVDDEQRGAIIDYLNAKATYDGMIQRVRDDIDSQVEANNTLIDQRKNITTGMVVHATLKQDDKAVFVKSGNVVLNDDGSVNNQESSESIVVMDEAGHTEMIAPSAIFTLGQTEEAEALKATQAQQIAEQYATMKGDQIDGILPFAQGDTYNIMDERGTQHSVQVVADNGDGSVQVAMDGATEAVTMPKEQIQAMSQAFNKARAVAYNEQKKAQEVAQQEPQAEQKAAEGQPAVVESAQKPVIPTLKDGTPDYNAMDADMFTEQYVSQFGEELTEKIARNNIKEADKAIASIQKQIDGITDPNKLPALYAKQQESEAKKAKYTTVIVNLGLSEDASEDNASRVQRMKKEATPRIAQLFPDGLPNVESVVMADIATGNKIRWTNKEVNGTIVSKGLGAELGLADSKAERTRRISMIGKDAPTPEEYAESLRERLDAMGIRYDESELRNQILNVYASVDTPKNAWEWLENMSANMQADQEGLDYEEEQMRRAYEQGIAGHPQDMDLVQPEPEIPSQEEYNQIAQEFANGKAKEVVAPTLQYELSDEVDENGRQFVKSSTGAIEFGQVDAESGLAYAPILLSEGIITNKATNDGYGLVHIEARHGGQIRKAGYNTVVEFIEDVAKNYEVIKEGNIRDGRNTYLLQLKDKHNNTLIVELSGDGTYWNINTAGVFKTSYGKNRKEVYNRHTTAKQPAETIEASRNSEPSGTQKFPSMVTASTLVSSDSKDTTSEPKSQEVAEKILQAEAETNIEPSEAQKEAGNYKKGHVSIDGLNITIENPKDTERSGVDENGQKWSVKMNNTYGYIRRTEGKDGDHIDLFLSDHIDDWNGNVFVVDQVKPDGSFDEHKVMYGFDTIEEAEQAYMSNYSIGWKGLGAITGTSKGEFKKWLDSSHRKTKPFAEYKAVKKAEGQSVSAERHNLADFKEGDVVRDYYDKKLYRIKKHSKNGVSTIAMLDEEGNEVYTTQMNAHSNSRYSLANAFVKTEIPTISQESEQTAEQPNVQQELTEKYIREDRAKAAEQGNNLSAYIKERKKENQSGFYKIRPKDEGVRFRVADTSFAHAYDEAFAELEREYQALDKTNEVEVNEWTAKKTGIVRGYFNLLTKELGLPTIPYVIDYTNEEDVKHAFDAIIAAIGEEEVSYDEFVEYLKEGDAIGSHVINTDIVFFNIRNGEKSNSSAKWLEYLVHENTHRVSEVIGVTDEEYVALWEICKQTAPKLAQSIIASEGNDSVKNGNEYLAHSIGTRASYSNMGDLLIDYLVGNIPVERVINSFKKEISLRDNVARKVLIELKNGYNQREDSRGRRESEGHRKEGLQGYPVPGLRLVGRGRVRRDLTALREVANELASQLNTPIRIVEDVNTITDNNAKLQERKRNAKGFYDRNTNEVVVVLPNATSVEDVRETIFHEVVGHKGLRELVGKERFNAFLDKVYANAGEEVRRRIAQRAAKLGWDFHEATEEYIAELAEQGFEERENRNFFEVVRDLFLDMLRRAKIALGYNISDNDLRYMLWRTYQMQRSKGAMAVAEDMVMQQKLGVGNFRARQVSEEEQIATKAKKNGSYLKAPNGKDTNLTPEQWVTVRTKAFKRWFGDWEKAARIEKLRTSESVSIVGNEIESSDDMKQYRKNALEYGKSLRGEYRNADTGRTIIINRDSLTEVLHHDGNNVAHIQSIAAIPQMVERGIFITSEPVSADASEKLKNAKEVQYYVCGLNIGGVPYTVKFVVAEYENGERYYDHSLTQIEKGDLLNRAELSSTVADSKSPISGIKDKRLVSILQTNSSKIVDANGEPLVVEHSTWNEDFHTFDISKLGESSGDNGIYGSGFYFGNVGETEMYGDRVIRSYLNVKNPFALPEDNMMQFFDYLVENFDKEGLRDVVVTNSGKSSSIGAIIDAIKEVKANHSRGEYNELIGAMGQYWTPSSAEDRVIEQTIFRKVGFAFYRSLTPFIEHNIGQIEFSEALRNAGYDGVIYDNHEYVAFYPNQIKLADGSNTFFDSDNDDIRFRDGGSTPSPAKPNANARDVYNYAVRRPNKSGSVKATHNLYFRLREEYQDSMLALKELQNAILKETGKTMRDWEDAYTAQNHMSSKNKAEAETYKNVFFKPLMEEVAKLATNGTKYEDVIRYLIAKHGLERNRVFSEREAKKAGKKWDGKIARDYSGLTDLTGKAEEFTEAAEAIVKEFEKKHNTDELWKRINAATKNTLKKNYDSGLISREDYEHVRNMFKYYIPLRGWDVDVASDEFEYLTSNRPLLSPSLKAAKGRLSLADDPLATIGYMAESAIIQGNRNNMKIRFLNFVLNNPTSLATVNRRWVVEQADGTWRYDDPIIPGDATADEVDAIVKAHNEKMRSLGDKATQKTDGLNLDLRASKQEGQEHTIRVRRNGVEYLIFINGDPAAAQAINGLTNPDVSESILRKGATYVKNLMSRAFTSQNPEFIILNLARDVIWAGTAVRIKEDAAYANRYKGNVTALLTSFRLPKLIKKFQEGTLDPNNEIERYFKEFVLNGGETGYTQINTAEDYKRDIKRILKEATNGVPIPKKAWRSVFGSIEFLNRSAEDLTRFAVYMTSRQQGRSISRSVTDAKEITVNFNRKGRGGLGADWINFAYIFSNAAIQSITNFARLTKNHPARTMKALAAFTSAGFMAPLISMIVYALLGDDEETYWDIPEGVRRNNIVLPIPFSKGYLTIPLPHELRPFYAIGELAMSVLLGKEEVEDALKEAAMVFADLIPVDLTGNGGNLIVNLTPTVVQPVVQLVANKDYFGAPIYRKYDYNEKEPEWTKAYRGSNAYLVDATRWLNEITGGDNHKRGAINLNPAVIEHLFEGYLGGAGKTLNKTAKTISMIWDEDSRIIRNVPVVSSFIQTPNKLTSNSNLNEEYYDAIDEFKETERILRGYKRDARMGYEEYAEKLSELVDSPTFQRYRLMKGYKDAIAKYSQYLVDVDPTTRSELETAIMELKVAMLDELEKLEEQNRKE